MVWTIIDINGPVKLIFVEGKIDSEGYQSILDQCEDEFREIKQNN